MRNLGGLALVALGLTLFGFYFQITSLVNSSISLSTGVQNNLASMAAKEKANAAELSASKTAIQQKLDDMRLELEQLRSMIQKPQPYPAPVHK